MHLKLVKLNPR